MQPKEYLGESFDLMLSEYIGLCSSVWLVVSFTNNTKIESKLVKRKASSVLMTEKREIWAGRLITELPSSKSK